MKFTELTEQEFKDFTDTRPEKNYFQTVQTYHRFQKEGRESFLVGVKDNNQVVAAALIACTNFKFMGKKRYEAYFGYILDYENKDLLKFLTNEIKNYLKSKNALSLIIDPYITKVSRDMYGNKTDELDNTHIIEYLKSIGYKETNESYQALMHYHLPINGKTAEELFKDFKGNTKNSINKTINKYKLIIRDLKKEELPEFKKITEETSERKNFGDKPLYYYENMYDAFKNEVVFKICELNCDIAIESITNENKEINDKIAKLSDAKANDKKKENYKFDIENNEKKINTIRKLKEEKGNIIPLATAMFMLYGDEVLYMYSGSYNEYKEFLGQYAIQWDIIKYACEHNYKRYNMYGILDIFDKNSQRHGVVEFKQSFGGVVNELLGAYKLPISKLNTLYEIIKKIKK